MVSKFQPEQLEQPIIATMKRIMVDPLSLLISYAQKIDRSQLKYGFDLLVGFNNT